MFTFYVIFCLLVLNIAYGNAELQRQICFNKVYDDDDDDDDDEQALSE